MCTDDGVRRWSRALGADFAYVLLDVKNRSLQDVRTVTSLH